MNISFYLLFFIWVFKSLRRHQFFQPNNLNKSIILLICIALFSVLIKIQLGEIPITSLLEEIQDVKNWINPFFVFFAVFNVIEDEKQCKQALMGLIFIIVFIGVTTLIDGFGIIDFDIIKRSTDWKNSRFRRSQPICDFFSAFHPNFVVLFFISKQTST